MENLHHKSPSVLSHLLILRIVLEAHTDNVLVLDSLDRRPSERSSEMTEDDNASLRFCGNSKAVQISPKRPQQAPTRASVRSGSWLITSMNWKMETSCGATICTSAESGKYK